MTFKKNNTNSPRAYVLKEGHVSGCLAPTTPQQLKYLLFLCDHHIFPLTAALMYLHCGRGQAGWVLPSALRQHIKNHPSEMDWNNWKFWDRFFLLKRRHPCPQMRLWEMSGSQMTKVHHPELWAVFLISVYWSTQPPPPPRLGPGTLLSLGYFDHCLLLLCAVCTLVPCLRKQFLGFQ